MCSIKEKVVNEIHKPTRKIFTRRRVAIKGLNDFIQVDLVKMVRYARDN